MNMKTNFNDLAYKLVNTTFVDVATPLTINTSDAVYDEELGELLDFNDSGATIQAIVGAFINTKDSAFDLETGDVRAIIPINALIINNISDIFLQSDTVTHNNITYTVIETQKDPSESVLTIQMRKA